MNKKHISLPCAWLSLQNAEIQLESVAAKWAADLKCDPNIVREEIRHLLLQKATVPFNEPIGEKFVNVSEINLELRQRYGSLPCRAAHHRIEPEKDRRG